MAGAASWHTFDCDALPGQCAAVPQPQVGVGASPEHQVAAGAAMEQQEQLSHQAGGQINHQRRRAVPGRQPVLTSWGLTMGNMRHLQL